MIWLAAAALAVAAVTVVAALQAVGQLVRSHARERNLMLNQLLHLAGRTWEPPPADEWVPPIPDPDEGRYVTSPEQLPENDWDQE